MTKANDKGKSIRIEATKPEKRADWMPLEQEPLAASWPDVVADPVVAGLATSAEAVVLDRVLHLDRRTPKDPRRRTWHFHPTTNLYARNGKFALRCSHYSATFNS